MIVYTLYLSLLGVVLTSWAIQFPETLRIVSLVLFTENEEENMLFAIR